MPESPSLRQAGPVGVSSKQQSCMVISCPAPTNVEIKCLHDLGTMKHILCKEGLYGSRALCSATATAACKIRLRTLHSRLDGIETDNREPSPASKHHVQIKQVTAVQVT